MRTGFLIHDRRSVKTVDTLDVGDPDMAEMLATLPMDTVDSGLDPYEPAEKVLDVPYDIKPLKLHFGEFLRHHSIAADSTSWTKQFKIVLPGVVKDASLMVMGDVPVATFRRDGKLAIKKLEAEQPAIIAKYMVRRVVEEFDVERFKKEDPVMYHAYRGRSFRLVKSGAGAGLVLPGS